MKDRKDLKAENCADYLGEMLVAIFNPKGLKTNLEEIDRDFKLMVKRAAAEGLEVEAEKEDL